jgi:hypothetical protein
VMLHAKAPVHADLSAFAGPLVLRSGAAACGEAVPNARETIGAVPVTAGSGPRCGTRDAPVNESARRTSARRTAVDLEHRGVSRPRVRERANTQGPPRGPWPTTGVSSRRASSSRRGAPAAVASSHVVTPDSGRCAGGRSLRERSPATAHRVLQQPSRPPRAGVLEPHTGAKQQPHRHRRTRRSGYCSAWHAPRHADVSPCASRQAPEPG